MKPNKEALLFWNPWWSKDTEELDSLKERGVWDEILPLFERKEPLVITGVRRAGKTRLMYLLIKSVLKDHEPGQVLYVNFDDPLFNDVTLDEVHDTFKEAMTPEGKTFLFFDEVQNREGWEKWVKKVYDSNQRAKIVVSGSNASLLRSDYSKHLGGREMTFEVFPLSLREILLFKGIDAGSEIEVLSKKAKIKHILEEYLRFGGFPEVVLEPNETIRYKILKEYFDTILIKDVVARHKIKERGKMEKLALFLLTNISNTTSAKSLGKMFELNLGTAEEYMKHIEDAYLAFFINHFSYSLKAQYTYPRKVYCIDPGLRNAVSFRFSEDLGRILENVVYLELRKTGDIYYWKDDRYEVDFVVKLGLKVVDIIQVCYSPEEDVKGREEAGLLAAMENFDLKSGNIVTWEHEESKRVKGKAIEYIPAWKWLLRTRPGTSMPR